MTALDLSDVSVAITRPETRATHLKSRLENLGADVVVRPLIGTQLPDDEGAAFLEAWSRLNDFSWVGVTSATSVATINQLGQGIEVPSSLRIAAVGKSTARALRSSALDVALTGDGSGGKSLAESMIQSARPASVLVVKAQDGRSDLEETLEEHGWTVTAVAAYVTRPVVMSDVEREELRTREVIVVASPSAVRALRDVLSQGEPARADQSIVAIGKTTGDAAEALEFPRVMVASKPDDDGLVAAIEKAVFGKW